MVVTEIELREWWRDGRNLLPEFPTGTRFSPAAQDFIKDHHINIAFADPAPAAVAAPQLPITHSQLPVTNYQLPFSLDTLHALTLLIGAEARRYQLPALAQRLDALAGYCLELRTAGQQGRDPAPMAPAPASGGPAFAPGPADHAILHWLNFLRATARQAAAQAGAGGNAKMAAALGQVSDTSSGLGQRVLSGELGWKPLGDLIHSA